MYSGSKLSFFYCKKYSNKLATLSNSFFVHFQAAAAAAMEASQEGVVLQEYSMDTLVLQTRCCSLSWSRCNDRHWSGEWSEVYSIRAGVSY